MLTTSFGQSIRRNQHCINLRSRFGSAASFVLNQVQKYDIRDYSSKCTTPSKSPIMSPSGRSPPPSKISTRASDKCWGQNYPFLEFTMDRKDRSAPGLSTLNFVASSGVRTWSLDEHQRRRTRTVTHRSLTGSFLSTTIRILSNYF